MEVKSGDKSKLLHLVLNNVVFKSHASISALNYILTLKSLEDIDFVDGIYAEDDNILTIGLQGTKFSAMTLRLGDFTSSKSEEILNKLRSEVLGKGVKLAVMFILPPDKTNIRRHEHYLRGLSFRNQPEEISRVMWEAENIARFNFINSQIDNSLDIGDKRGFYHYTNELVKVYDEFLSLYDGEEHYEKS